MKAWFTANIRMALWIHVLFLLVLDLSWAPAPLSSVATGIYITLFLPHTLIAMKLGGFSTDYPMGQLVIRSVISLIAALPVSLAYASLLHRIARAIHTMRTRSVASGADV